MNRVAFWLPEAPAAEPTPQAIGRPWRSRSLRQAMRCALQGLQDAWQTQHNLRLHVYAGAAVITAGAWLHLALMEWLWVSFAIGLVIFAELMNTAIEQAVDLTMGLRPDPLARHIKDLAAGCVLIAAVVAIVIGALILVPKMGPVLFFFSQR